jgi:Nickel responsive protein SCO4226-like
MPMIVVEKTWETPMTKETLMDAGGEMLGCLAARHGRWVRSMITPDGKRTVCTFEAPDAEAVRQAYREVGTPYDKIWTADVMEAEPTP